MESKIKITGNWFVDKLTEYQSANSDNESLKRNFVIRTHEFSLIIDDLKTKKNNDPLQHELILGRRGSGKSTLLKRLQIEIEEDTDLSKKYIPINLAEEQAGIYRLSDLWFEVLNEINNHLDYQTNLREFSSFENNEAFTRYLYAEIHQILVKNDKKAVLLLDNLDRILENFNEDAHLFREILQNYNDVQIIGGSTRMDEHFWKYDKPFYEFFRRHRLEALSFDEIHLIMGHWSDTMQIPELKDYALQNRGKIEALRILTDGLPRTLQFFIQILLHESNLYGFDYIKNVMNKATPLYQERLNNLTPPQRKIVLELAFIWEAASTKQLVDKCRMESKLISSYLKQLYSFGIVEKIETQTKNHLYRLSERFFTMWLIVTQGNPEQKRKAKFLTIFLETWYNSQEMQSLASGHLAKLKGKNIDLDKALVLTKAFSQSKYISTDLRDELIENTLELSKNENIVNDLPVKYKTLESKIQKLDHNKDYQKALDLVDEIENEEDGIKFLFKAYFLSKLANFSEVEKYYLLAIEKGNIKALFHLAFFYHNHVGSFEMAKKYYLLAIEKGDTLATYNIALLYQHQGIYEEAEKYYLISIGKGDITASNNLAILYRSQEKYDKAEKYLLIATEKGDTNSLRNLALLYFEINIKKQQALSLIKKYSLTNRNPTSLQLALTLEIWNGIFENIEKKLEDIFEASKLEKLETLFKNLLYLEQKNLVLSYFESEKYGKELQERYSVLYYATLILCNRKNDNLELRIPPEVMPTVQEIVEVVKEKNAFYQK